MNQHSPLLVKVSTLLLVVGGVLWTAGYYTEKRLQQERSLYIQASPNQNTEAKIPIKPKKPEPTPQELAYKKFLQRHRKIHAGLQVAPSKKPSFTTRGAKAGILMNLSTGEVLWAKNIENAIPIASLTKMMTVWTALEEIRRRPDLKLSSRALISKSASLQRHSKVLRNYPGKTITLQELIMSAMIKSANDSAHLLAEHIGKGNAKNFIAQMNKRANQIYMRKSIFYNAHGLPGAYVSPAEPDNVASVRDLCHLVIEMKQYPQIERWTSMRELTLPIGSKNPPLKLGNTNRLIEMRGVTGLKTGFTNNAGWCLATTQKGRHNLLSIVLGCPSKTERDRISRNLLNWGQRQ